MDILILIVIVFAVGYVVHRFRGNALAKAAAPLGLKAHEGALLAERAEIAGFLKLLGGWHEAGWGHGVRGTRSGASLLVQEIELTRSLGSTRHVKWYTLVHWRLPEAGLPRFRLEQPGRVLPSALLPTSITEPVKAALGLHTPDPVYRPLQWPASEAERAFPARWEASGEQLEAVAALLTPARRRDLSALPPMLGVAGLGDDLVALLPGRLDSAELQATLDRVGALRAAFAHDEGPFAET